MRIALFSLLSISGCCCAFAEEAPYFVDNGFGNPVATIQHPCAEQYKGVTYIAYQGPHEDPFVCAYTQATETWRGPVRAGVSALGKTPDPTDHDAVDNHGRPALLIDAEGYIHLVFGGHGGGRALGDNLLGTPGRGEQCHVVSRWPEDISAWKRLDNIDPFGTYSQWIKMPDNDIYLFYRHGSHQSDWVYQKSEDNARSFAPPVSVLKHKTQEADRNIHDAWYAWFDQGRGDTITASYIYHPCRVIGHTNERYNGYYMQMACAGDTWTNAAGKPLPMPLTKEEADAKTLIVNTGSERSSHGVCRVDATGKPHLFFRQGKGEARYYRWLGDAWQTPVAVTGTHRSEDGDMLIEDPLVVRLLLTHQEGEESKLSYWKTTDGGLHWALEKTLFSLREHGLTPSALVRNGGPEARLVVSEQDRSQPHLYRRLYLIGDNGPIMREKAAATIPHPVQDAAEEGVVGQQGTVQFLLHSKEGFCTGPGVKTKQAPLLRLPGIASLVFSQMTTVCTLEWIWDRKVGAQDFQVEFPRLAGDENYYLLFTWDAPAGRFNGYINGLPLQRPGMREAAWTLPECREAKREKGSFSSNFLRMRQVFLDAAQAYAEVPEALRDQQAALFGLADPCPAPLATAAQRGDLLYESSLKDDAATQGWIMEGPGAVALDAQGMTLTSSRAESALKNGHFVYWCPADFPAAFIAEWEMEVLSEYGLCILFFAAQGAGGKDLFDPALPERTGVFKHYTQGAINCYHISYHANTPSAPGRMASNLRKNAGFHLMANGAPGIPADDHRPHTLRLVKAGGHIQLQVDGRPVLDYTDDGKAYGPVYDGGKIGFRQMQWTQARYRNLRVYELAK